MTVIRMEDDYTKRADQVKQKNREVTASFNDTSTSVIETNIQFIAASQALTQLNSALVGATSSLRTLGLITNEQQQALIEMNAILTLITAPMQTYIALQQLATLVTFEHALAASAAATAILGIFFAYQAVKSEDAGQRAILSVLTGLTWALTAAELALGVARVSGTTLGFGTVAYVALVAGALATVATLAIPSLGHGGVVPPQPGGVPVILAEEGQTEIAAPEPLLREIVREESGGGGITINEMKVTVVTNDPLEFERQWTDTVRRRKQVGHE